MSPEAATADRIYHSLKQMIMSGRFASGLPIIVQPLAEEFGISISPVRDALHRLLGERMVEVQPGGGFAMPIISGQIAYYLYAWHSDLVRMILKSASSIDRVGGPPVELIEDGAAQQVLARVTADFFTRLAGCSDNPEHLEALISAGDRLHLLRLHETRIARLADELHALWNLVRSGNRNAVRIAMWQYHRRRLSRATMIADAVNAAGPRR